MSLAAILMNSCMALAWWSVAAAGVARLGLDDPAIAKKMEQVSKASQALSYEQAQNDTEVQKFFDTINPIFSQVNWWAVALVTALLAFSLLGFLYAAISGQAEWLGWLPMIGLATGQNPALLSDTLVDKGISAAQLTLGQQVAVLAVELLAVYAFGVLGARWHARRKARQGDQVTT